MKANRNYLFIIPLVLIWTSCDQNQKKEPTTNQESNVLVLENEQIALNIDLQGGMYTGFNLKEHPVNPFGWQLNPMQMPKNNQPHVFKGHFLCTGRWGAPSEGEIKAGIPHNGEVNTQLWKITKPVEKSGEFISAEMSCTAPIEKLDVKREVRLPQDGSYFLVKENFTNNLPVGRISNIVQHVTIAAPFLTPETIINTNAGKGFDQRTNFAYLEDSSFVWPNARLADGTQLDLRTVTSEKGFVTTHIFDESEQYGWITAYNPAEKLVLGYIWKTAEYPWVNVWHQSKDGKPLVQGLEFGTTGLGKPYQLLLENKATFFGRNSFIYMDAGETLTKSWMCFQVKVPENFGEVKQIQVTDQKITLKGLGNEASLKCNLPSYF